MRGLCRTSLRWDRYQEFTRMAQGGLFASIAVPSTLYFRKDKDGLRGVRISISETMRLEGARECFSNRDYTLFNRISAETNAMAQQLLDLGAVLVGQTKVPELLAGRWKDSSKPWNPRGDQLQDSGAGSPGAAVAVAGYDWLQVAFAVDCKTAISRMISNINKLSVRRTTNPSCPKWSVCCTHVLWSSVRG